MAAGIAPPAAEPPRTTTNLCRRDPQNRPLAATPDATRPPRSGTKPRKTPLMRTDPTGIAWPDDLPADADDPVYTTLAEFAAEVDRSEATARYTWTRSPTFPTAVPGLRRKRPGQTHGPGANVYVRAQLWHWYTTAGPAGPPATLAVPDGINPDQLMTLSAIARTLNITPRNVTRNRDIIDPQVPPTRSGAYKQYPIGPVVDVLNTRPGKGAEY